MNHSNHFLGPARIDVPSSLLNVRPHWNSVAIADGGILSKAKLKHIIDRADIKSWRLLMSAFQSVYSQLEKGLASEGVSVSRFQVLFYLYFEPRMKASELSRKLLVTRSNMSMFLRRMETDGLILFDLPSGQKRPEVLLTPKGIKFFESIFPTHATRVGSLVKPFGSQTIRDLEELQHRVSRRNLK